MSDVGAELPASQDSGMWWNENEGEWQPIPPGMISTETSSWVLAINDVEYPALSELVRHADDVEGYLEMFVSEDSNPERDDSSAASAEGEGLMGMGE